MKRAFLGLLTLAVYLAVPLMDCSAAAVDGAKTDPYVWISDSVVVRAIDAKVFDTLAMRLALSPRERTPFLPVDSTPAVVTQAHTIYPDTAMTLKLEAEIWVEALVGADGTVRMARILKGDISGKTAGLGFERSALTSAMQTTYKPALRGRKPVESWVAYKIAFRLN